MAQDQESPVLPKTKEDQLALLKRLLDPTKGSKLNEAAAREALTQQFGDKAREAATVVPPTQQPERIALPAPIELTHEVLAECLAGLERDYKRGIVVVDETKEVDDFKAALKQDKTAGTPWEAIQGGLEAGDSRLLKEAAKLQGKGTLIGVYPDGKLCIKDRGNEPVIFATLEGKQIEITTDAPNRAELMEGVDKEGQFADYWQIRGAVRGQGLELPPDADPEDEKKGIVAAAEAVTGEDFVRSASGKEHRSAVLECGDVAESSRVRVVRFDPRVGFAGVDLGDPRLRFGARGAVRVLRG